MSKPKKEIPITQQFFEIATLDKNTGKSPVWEITAENIAKLIKVVDGVQINPIKLNWYFSDDKQYLSLEATFDNIVVRIKMNPISMFLNAMEHLQAVDNGQLSQVPSKEILASFMKEMILQMLKHGDKIEQGMTVRDQVKLGLKSICILRAIETGKEFFLPPEILEDLVEKTILNLEHDLHSKE